jgi:hypothetical protein
MDTTNGGLGTGGYLARVSRKRVVRFGVFEFDFEAGDLRK